MRKQSMPIVQQNLFDIEAIEKKFIGKSHDAVIEDVVFDLVDALQAPVLTFSSTWADTIPRRLLDRVPIARMIALKTGDRTASYVEVVIYIYTRTLEAPMDSDWVDIYTHVSCRVVQEWFDEDRWDEVKAPRELNPWLQSMLDQLRSHIYEKRRSILNERIKAEEKAVQPTQDESRTVPASSHQQSLF